MLSAHYYQQQAKSLLSWAKATKDQVCARRLLVQAVTELERAKQAHETVANLNPASAEFNTPELLQAQ